MIQRRRLFIPTVPLSDPHRRLRPLLGQLRPLSTSNGSGKEAPPAPAPVDGDGGIVTREEAYRQIHDLDFMKAAKILFTTPPKRKQFGFDFHLVQFFFVCMPSLAVYLVAQYARYEIRRMEAPQVKQFPRKWNELTTFSMLTQTSLLVSFPARLESSSNRSDLESKVAELEPEPEPDIAAKSEPEPIIIDEPKSEPEIEKPLVKTSADLLAELIMEVVPPTPVVRVPMTLISPDLYDSLQIFLQQTGSQLIRQFMVRMIVDSVLIREDTPLFAICVLLELSSSIADLSRKPVLPPPPWLRHDALVLILRPPPWPD